MRRLLALTLVALSLPLATAHAATCNEEVDAAFAKQREAGAFRMVSNLINERGLVQMTVDYVLPNKLHQTAKSLTDPKPSEIILIGNQAWSNNGEGWKVMPDDFAEELHEQMRQTVVEPPKDPLSYKCGVDAELDGRPMKLYVGTEPEKNGNHAEGLPVRRLYVDPETGRPVRNEVAPVGKPERPFFTAKYTYPDSIKIEPPATSN
ncbi:hypothetical protein SAMN04488061_2728 [Filomicrobium insigne]|uniref:Uncharacterized protein n=1 Tax=Filomicrobium insigne TaxID=418854 RepID=A0A1H0RIS8_9HYPH|nr:hypothetical protein [Filomicrobium insigne]SDP28798.1 hypothetical protein SAMN04488061_2728 [Filomicrobium insigne]